MTQPIQREIYNTPVYKRSRWSYALECAFEYFVSLMISGAFLAKLLSHIGLDDALIGIISSFVSFAFLFQLGSIFIVQRLTRTKLFVVLFHTLSNLLFMSLYLIPFLPWAYEIKEGLVIFCVLAAYFGKYIENTILYRWANSYVDPHHRAEFSAVKEMISLVSGIVVTLAAGKIIDGFEARGDMDGSFIFCAVAVLIFSLCDFICLMLIKSDRGEKKKTESVPLREALQGTLGNKNFRSVILLAILWNVASYTTIGFMGTYQVNANELAFSVGAVQIINMVGSLGRFALSQPFGRYSDRTSFAHGMKLALFIAAAAFGCVIFTTPATRYLVIGYVLLHAVCMAGINANMLNIIYSYVDEKYFVQASAIKNSVGGVCGFLASLAASRILAAVQENGNEIFSIPVYGQQVLGLISTVILIGTVFFVHFVIEKQKVMKQ